MFCAKIKLEHFSPNCASGIRYSSGIIKFLERNIPRLIQDIIKCHKISLHEIRVILLHKCVHVIDGNMVNIVRIVTAQCHSPPQEYWATTIPDIDTMSTQKSVKF